jgi:hypothetical protein
MAENLSTILIPDISGFTEFMTNTELLHGTYAINELINAIVAAVEDEYEVAEIEGDAVLLVRGGPAPSQQEILDICLKIFNAFHFTRKMMQNITICPCKACQDFINLSLKFVVHHGPLADIRVGKFVKHSGPEMIVAHRLLKNSINSDEYLLMTEKVIANASPLLAANDLEWISASDEYASIGKIAYRFTLLESARSKTPDPPMIDKTYRTDDSSFVQLLIKANFRDVYMVLINIAGRPGWFSAIKKVEQNDSHPYVGSTHHCFFEGYKATISPIRMELLNDSILYAERCRIEEFDLSLVHEFRIADTGENLSLLSCRLLNNSDAPINETIQQQLHDNLHQMVHLLKEQAENMGESLFTPIAKNMTAH